MTSHQDFLQTQGDERPDVFLAVTTKNTVFSDETGTYPADYTASQPTKL